MTGTSPTTAAEVAEAARIITGAGLVEAFGHVSARTGDGFLITSTRPLGAAAAADVHQVGADGGVAEGTTDVPLETPMHAAVYEARPDVGAIARTHSPAAVRAGVLGEIPPLTHGLGGLAGEVALSARTDLVADREAGQEIARDLGQANCLLIRGNGSIATGRSLAEAVVRARYLEERCLVSEEMEPADGWRAELLEPRARWFETETTRAWAWLRWRYGGER
ncbi:MAG: class II aldolase/adducin family protein [Solirubrobacterales bacterium]|nr:class II aldolase/adducin family protein [Solirubrobacterales bacterium]